VPDMGSRGYDEAAFIFAQIVLASELREEPWFCQNWHGLKFRLSE
jgi:hypothetical protein